MMEESKKSFVLSGMAIGFLVVALVIFLLWYFIFEYETSTKDAYVHGNQVVVSAQVPGFVQSVNAEETQVVKEGAILVILDKTDQEITLATAVQNLAQTVRQVSALFQKVEELRAEKELREVDRLRAEQDYAHRKGLIESGGVSIEDFEHAEAEFLTSSAALKSIEHQLLGTLAQVVHTTVETHPLVEEAKEQVREAYISLERCTIRSPVHGMIAERQVQVGEAVNSQTPLMKVIPLDQMWVHANFKETELRYVKIGQPVTLKSDFYDNEILYHGKVVGIVAGTGNVFSVLPPQNATGNWIKIVQRLPVRVSLNPEELANFPLRLGLSMHVTIDTHKRTGQINPAPIITTPLFETDIFEKQQEGVEYLIAEIIEENLVNG